MENFRAILASDLAAERNVQQWFESVARVVLSPSARLVVVDPADQVRRFQLVEIEFYLYDASRHPDQYAHQRPIQLHTFGHWYFHSSGQKETNYKGGTYKGLDLTFGAKGKVLGGILFRSMVELPSAVAPCANAGLKMEQAKSSGDPGDVVIEGPSKLVDRLLHAAQQPTIAALVKSCSDTGSIYIDALDASSRLRLEIQQQLSPPDLELICGPRVGLPWARLEEPGRFEYLFKPYRFVSLAWLSCIKKSASSLAMSFWHVRAKDGQRTETWENVVKKTYSSATLERWTAFFLQRPLFGKTKRSCSGSVSVPEYLALYGTWCAMYMSR